MNTYPDLAEKIRGLVGKATRTQRDAKHDELVRGREVNRSLMQELAETRADLAKLASINQVLLNEVALFKGMATGKVVSILQPKGACSRWLMVMRLLLGNNSGQALT